ncbi:MAG: hypothetical protein ACTHLW_20785, partial [Verrucomicrobiota bacterium]
MLTAHELFGFMSPTLANEIVTFTAETDKPTYRATLNAVAEARHVRLVFMERQPKPQRHATMISMLGKPALEMISGNLIRTWLVKKYRAMLTTFLNTLEIPNEEGVVENLPESVDDAKLRGAVDALLAQFPHEAVAVYLNAFNDMNEA